MDIHIRGTVQYRLQRWEKNGRARGDRDQIPWSMDKGNERTSKSGKERRRDLCKLLRQRDDVR